MHILSHLYKEGGIFLLNLPKEQLVLNILLFQSLKDVLYEYRLVNNCFSRLYQTQYLHRFLIPIGYTQYQNLNQHDQ